MEFSHVDSFTLEQAGSRKHKMDGKAQWEVASKGETGGEWTDP
jgi:hypothetical protein